MKKTMIALAMVWAAGLTVTMTDLQAAPTTGKVTAPTQELLIKGKKPVLFSHAKHAAVGLDCATCHHDAKHQPLNEAAIGGVKNTASLQCATCHNATFANAKLQKPMDVFHGRCKTCHTTGVNGKKGPTACTGCHDKTAAAAPEQKATPAPTAAPEQAVTTAPVTAPAAAPTPAKKKGKAVEGC